MKIAPNPKRNKIDAKHIPLVARRKAISRNIAGHKKKILAVYFLLFFTIFCMKYDPLSLCILIRIIKTKINWFPVSCFIPANCLIIFNECEWHPFNDILPLSFQYHWSWSYTSVSRQTFVLMNLGHLNELVRIWRYKLTHIAPATIFAYHTSISFIKICKYYEWCTTNMNGFNGLIRSPQNNFDGLFTQFICCAKRGRLKFVSKCSFLARNRWSRNIVKNVFETFSKQSKWIFRMDLNYRLKKYPPKP